MERISDFKDHPVYNVIYVNPEKSVLTQPEVVFQGTGNILFVEDGVSLGGSRIQFMGSDSVIYLSRSSASLLVSLVAGERSAIYIGRENYFNDTVHILATEWQNVILGGRCAISSGIWIRTADPHLIYRCGTRERLNDSQPILIGDHVWLGQDVLVLKGTKIGSGAVVGGGSVVANKRLLSNASYAGNPVRLIQRDVFWIGFCTHTWLPQDTKARRTATEQEADWATYRASPDNQDLEEISRTIQQQSDAAGRLSVIKRLLVINQKKDRFYMGAVDDCTPSN